MRKKYTRKQFISLLKGIDSEVSHKGRDDAALAGGFYIEGQAKINVVRKSKSGTGNLAGSIQTDLVQSTPERSVVHVGPSAIYGRIQELGGTIVPVNAKRLHWVDESGIHHTALKVTIPARPYLTPAAEDNMDELNEVIATNFRLTVEGMV